LILDYFVRYKFSAVRLEKMPLKLQQTVRFFETLLRASADGIMITDPAKNIVFVNYTYDELEMHVRERTCALSESEEKYRRLFEYSNDIIVQADKTNTGRR